MKVKNQKAKNKLVKTENEHQHASGGYVIPSEVGDGIAVAVLKDYQSYLQGELDAWRVNPRSDNNPEGVWLHPEDVAGNIRRIDALDLIIRDFGG